MHACSKEAAAAAAAAAAVAVAVLSIPALLNSLQWSPGVVLYAHGPECMIMRRGGLNAGGGGCWPECNMCVGGGLHTFCPFDMTGPAAADAAGLVDAGRAAAAAAGLLLAAMTVSAASQGGGVSVMAAPFLRFGATLPPSSGSGAGTGPGVGSACLRFFVFLSADGPGVGTEVVGVAAGAASPSSSSMAASFRCFRLLAGGLTSVSVAAAAAFFLAFPPALGAITTQACLYIAIIKARALVALCFSPENDCII